MYAFLDSLDIANRALQHIGQPRINSVDEDSRANAEVALCYDKLRRAELMRNVWTFATRKAVLRAVDTDTMLLDPQTYDATVTYEAGALVKDDNGSIWQSLVPENLNNTPGSSSAWESYFGPLSVHLYDATETYHTGELVYKAAGNAGGYVVFMSLENDNDDVPSTGAAYDATVTYHAGDVVTYGGYSWRSLIEFNIGTTPAVPPLDWDANATYTTAETVTASDGYIYSSVGTGNTGHNPVDGGGFWTNTAVPAAWTRSPAVYESAKSWRPVYAAVRSFGLRYPIGAGPSSQLNTRNVFRLPSGFLRRAHTDPKAGSNAPLGGPGALDYEQRDIEGQFIVSPEVGPVTVRFVGDVTTVTDMNDLFCEGLGARIGYEVCEPLAQSTAKKGECGAAYNKFMGEARMVNAIEVGPVEAVEDEYISCRR